MLSARIIRKMRTRTTDLRSLPTNNKIEEKRKLSRKIATIATLTMMAEASQWEEAEEEDLKEEDLKEADLKEEALKEADLKEEEEVDSKEVEQEMKEEEDSKEQPIERKIDSSIKKHV